MGYRTPGIESESLPVHIVQMFKDAYVLRNYVETGTAGGSSVAIASQLFERCYTIELIDGRVVEKNLPNVEYFTGNSVDILPNIITNFINELTFFFLDAHFSDSVPNTSGIPECPLIDELRIISSHHNPIILIDDARLFMGHPPYPCDPREWPTIEQIFAKTQYLFPNHHTTIIDDFILIYPDPMCDVVSAEWRKRFHIRYPSSEDRLQTSAKNVFTAIKNYLDV